MTISRSTTYKGYTAVPQNMIYANDKPLRSATGFSWGYIGGGPAETARALLKKHCRGDRRRARNLQLDFLLMVVAKLPPDWCMTGEQLDAALLRIETDAEVRRETYGQMTKKKLGGLLDRRGVEGWHPSQTKTQLVRRLIIADRAPELNDRWVF